MAQIQNTLEYLYNQNVYFDWDLRAPLGHNSSTLSANDISVLREYSYCLNSPTAALSATYSFFLNDMVEGLTYFDAKYWIEEIKKQKDVVVSSEYLLDLDSVATIYHQVPDLNGITVDTVAVDNFDNNSKSKTINYYNNSFAAANSSLNLEIVNLRNNNIVVDSLSVTQMPTVKTDMLEYISIILPKSAILTTANTVVVGDVALEPRYKTIHYVSSSLSSMNIYTNTLKVLDYETYRANTALSP